MPKKEKDAPQDPRRNLASVSALLEQSEIKELLAANPRPVVMAAINEALAWFRANLKSTDQAPTIGEVEEKIEHFLAKSEQERLRPAVNATGIILHTGLGRALLPHQAAVKLAELDKCCNLQIDLETGARGKRNYLCERLLCQITGAEAATIVNNNAAATMLLLAALCTDKEVVVSRGQLIEIGGSFRLPDCIHSSGAKLVEVGTTNRTHLYDYERAINENTGALFRCNTSNFRIQGFTKEVPIEEMATLKEQHPDLLVIDDLGCGALMDLKEYGLPHEPMVQESIAGGADIVCFSGDKLISGPQAGIIIGRHDLIKKIKKHPLSRMLRVGKLTDIALEHTLRLFLEPEKLADTNPTLAILAKKEGDLKRRANRLKGRLEKIEGPFQYRVIPGESAMGGGSLPGVAIPTWVLAIKATKLTPTCLSLFLRKNEPPIVTRVANEEIHLDMRTLIAGDDEIIVNALGRIS